MRNNLKQKTFGILATLLLIVGPFLTALPNGAHADSSCLAGILATKGKQLAQGVANQIQAVPTYDSANHSANSETAGQTTGFTIQRCIVEPLVTIMARSLLDNFTAQTVNWINNGFSGSPLYVTNLQGFLADAADQAAGTFIEGLGPIGSIVCSPFDFQLRISLGIQYSRPDYYQYVGCRLSDIQKNVQRAFTTGVFGKNGWDNWLNLTVTPQNNIYGSYLQAVNTVDARIAGVQFRLTKQLDFGKGFLSSVDPKTGKITTPGSLIEDQLSNTLGEQVHRVGLAKDLDAILGALVGQLINQVLGGVGGLAGASTPSYDNGGQSAVDKALKSSSDQIISENNQAKNLPDGLYVNGIGPTGANGPTGLQFCNEFNKNIYGVDTPTNTQPTLTSPVLVKINGVVSKTASYTPTVKIGADNTTTKWTVANYNNVVLYCKNIDKTTSIANGTNEFIDGNNSVTAPVVTKPATQAPPDRSINLNSAKLNQSYVGIDGDGRTYGPQNAVGGYSFSWTSGGPAPHWWSAALNQSDKVQIIKVRSYPGHGTGNEVYLANMPADKTGIPVSKNDIMSYVVFHYPSSNSGANSNFTFSGSVDDFTITLNQPITANAIVVSNPNEIAIYKVELYKPSTNTSSNTTGGGPVDSSSPLDTSFAMAQINNINKNPGDSFSNALVLDNNQDIPGLRVRISLKSQDGTSFSLSTLFDSFQINETTKPENKKTEFVFFADDMSQTTFTYNKSLTLTSANSLQIDQIGHIKSSAVLGYKYQLITEVYKPATNTSKESVIATQTSTINVQ